MPYVYGVLTNDFWENPILNHESVNGMPFKLWSSKTHTSNPQTSDSNILNLQAQGFSRPKV